MLDVFKCILNFILIRFNTLLVILIVSIISSCSNTPAELKESFKEAGGNKKELTKVIDYFGQNPEDSLKLEAAIFLIENMKWHTGFFIGKDEEKGLERLLLQTKELADSVLEFKKKNPNIRGNFSAYESGVKLKAFKTSIDFSLFEQIDKVYSQSLLKLVEGEYLIDHINKSFAFWDRINQRKPMEFDTFKKVILPLQVANEPIFTNTQIFDSLYYHTFFNGNHYTEDQRDSIVLGINQYFTWYRSPVDKPLDVGLFGFFLGTKNSCFQNTSSAVALFRNLGLECYMDFIPTWLDSNNGGAKHYWCNLNKDGAHQLLFDAYSVGDGYILKDRCVGKVYRTTFEANIESPIFLKKPSEEVPSLYNNPCFVDVTDLYVKTFDIQVPVTQKQNNSLLYFCVFSNGEWSPLHFGLYEASSQTVTFKKMAYNTAGCVMSYENGQFLPASEFVYIENDGSVSCIKATEKLGDMLVERKYPWKKRMRAFSARSTGNYIQAANKPDFSDALTLDSMADVLEPKVNLFKGSDGKRFKYYRHIAPKGWKKTETAIVRFLATSNEVAEKTMDYHELKGEIIGKGKDFEKVFDNNWETFSEGNWSGMAFEKPVAVDAVAVVPRNGNNGIVEGDTYELSYWADGWISSEIAVAKDTQLKFQNVRKSAVYLINNLTKGKEVLPFIYTEGQQYFINFDTLNIKNNKPVKY